MAPIKKNNCIRSYAWILLAALLVSHCAKSPSTILRNGVEVPIEQAAKLDYDTAEAEFTKGRYPQALKLFKSVSEQFASTSYADNALFRLSQIYQKQNQLPLAMSCLESLVSKYPSGDIIHIAKFQLGMLYYSQKNYKAAAETLSTVPLAGIPDAARKNHLESVAADSFDKAGLTTAKLKWLLTLYDERKGSVEATAMESKITALLNSVKNPEDLERLLDERQEKFPAPALIFKIGQLYYEQSNGDQAKKWFGRYLEKYPNQEFYKEAQRLYGFSSLAPSGDVDPLAIGVLLPLTGQNQSYGQALQRGLSVAAMPNVKIFVENVGDSAEAAQMAVSKLIKEHKVIAILGPLSAKASQAAALTAQAQQVPLIVWSASEGMTAAGHVFRNSFTKSEQAVGLAYLAYEVLNIRRAAILYPQNPYGSEFMKLFWKEFVSRGGDVRRMEAYDPQNSDLVPPVKKLLGTAKELTPPTEQEICTLDEARARARTLTSGGTANPCRTNKNYKPTLDFEALLIPDSAKKAGELIPTLSYYDVKGVQWLGTNLWNSPDLFRGKNEQSLQAVMFLDGSFKSSFNPQATLFMDAYQKQYQSEPGSLEAQAYDTGLVVSHIINQMRPRSRQDFRQSLLQIKDFEAAMGKITVLPNGEFQHKLTPFIVDGTEIKELR